MKGTNKRMKCKEIIAHAAEHPGPPDNALARDANTAAESQPDNLKDALQPRRNLNHRLQAAYIDGRRHHGVTHRRIVRS